MTHASTFQAQVNSAEEGSPLIKALEEYATLLKVYAEHYGESLQKLFNEEEVTEPANAAEQLKETKNSFVTKILLEQDINAVKDNKTALHLAVEIGDIEIVKALIHYGSDLNIKNKDGKTALDLASDSSLEIRAMLETSSYRAIDNEIQQIESSVNSLQEDELEKVKNDNKLISEYDIILAATQEAEAKAAAEEAKAATKLQAIVRGRKVRSRAAKAARAEGSAALTAAEQVAPTPPLQVTTEQPVGSKALLELSRNTAIELTEGVKLPTQEESREQSKLLLEEGGVKTEGLSDEEIAQKVFQSIPQNLEGNKQQTRYQQTSEDVRRQAAVQKQEV